MNSQSALEFYNHLKPFSDFSKVGDEANFKVVPPGWSLVLSDIKGSTSAIQEGLYKQVNLIGAATIAAYINMMETTDLPFVFGGDGATLLVPDSKLEKLLTELKQIQRLSTKQFELELRVGAISVDQLNRFNQVLKVAKYELSPGNYLAQISGGALSYAEDLMKNGSPLIKLLSPHPVNETPVYNSLDGLSCRLSPIRSTKGKMLTLLCKPMECDQPPAVILDCFMQNLTAILNNDLQTANPARLENLKWPIPPRELHNEASLTTLGPYWLRWLGSGVRALISNSSLRFNIPLGPFSPRKYKSELPLNSDFKKFDETLRMVLDCTDTQIEAILALLESLRTQGSIAYGTHITDHALMTCIVQSPTRNKHVHFIDGAQGGYATASIQLKEQLKTHSRPGKTA